MKLRSVKNLTYGQQFKMGPLRVRQPLPAGKLEQISPFVLLHHAGPTQHPANAAEERLSPHPHRGFEPVTFLFSGKLHHKDSAGNEGLLESGDVQWMTAGSGILHSEGPSPAFAKEGGTLELIQLWVNLPRDYKMTAPKYQDLKRDSFPLLLKDDDKLRVRVVAGGVEDQTGPASTFSPILALMLDFDEGAHATFSIPHGYNALLYVLDGDVESNTKRIERYNLAQFDTEGDGVEIKTFSKGHALLLAGEPINEPVVSYGPFVMNYPGEIKQAILDYESGKMGVLES